MLRRPPRSTRTDTLFPYPTLFRSAEIDVLVDRVSRREGRPLLAGKDPRTVLTELAEKRNPIYALAPIHIQSMAAPHEATVDKIMKALERSEEHTSELQSLMRISYAVFCLKKKQQNIHYTMEDSKHRDKNTT